MQCKLSVIGQAVAEFKNAVDPALTSPFEKHFHPAPMRAPQLSKTNNLTLRLGHPVIAVNALPLKKQVRKSECPYGRNLSTCVRRL
jgi:mitochondrial transcription factor 1